MCPVLTDLVVSAKKCYGCSVPLHWCGQSSRDLTVYGLTGRNLGPSLQYFAPGNRSHSSGTYRRKSVTMVPVFEKKKIQLVSHLLSTQVYMLAAIKPNCSETRPGIETHGSALFRKPTMCCLLVIFPHLPVTRNIDNSSCC